MSEQSMCDNMKTDTNNMRCAVRVRAVNYGDNRRFYEYRIMMRLRGKLVGTEGGPSRKHTTPASARQAGLERIRVLKTHDLFAIQVTQQDIRDGEARSSKRCAIALALWRNRERMGVDRFDGDIRVEPYGGMFVETNGIVVETGEQEKCTGVETMPDVVCMSRHGLNCQPMLEWAMIFDDYANLRHQSIKEWREERGYDDGETPCKPWPVSFVLNMTEMKKMPA